jgi:hypothetical protein
MNHTVCCKHHLCGECASEIMERIPAFRAGYETGTVREAKPAPCPHCGAESLRLAKIRSHEEARNYSDSPAVISRMRGSTATPGRVAVHSASPLKVGDSMENLMRKMLTYEQCGINIKAEQRITVVGDMTTPGRPGSESPPLCDRVELDANNLPNVPFFCPLPEDRAHNPAQNSNPAPECREGGDSAERHASSEGLRESSGREGGGMMLMAPVDMRGRLAGAERERERVEGVAPGRPPLHGSRNFSRSRSISPLPALPADATAAFGGESFGGCSGSVFLSESPEPALPSVAEIAPEIAPIAPELAPIARIAWSVNVAEAVVGAGGGGGEVVS